MEFDEFASILACCLRARCWAIIKPVSVLNLTGVAAICESPPAGPVENFPSRSASGLGHDAPHVSMVSRRRDASRCDGPATPSRPRRRTTGGIHLRGAGHGGVRGPPSAAAVLSVTADVTRRCWSSHQPRHICARVQWIPLGERRADQLCSHQSNGSVAVTSAASIRAGASSSSPACCSGSNYPRREREQHLRRNSPRSNCNFAWARLARHVPIALVPGGRPAQRRDQTSSIPSAPRERRSRQRGRLHRLAPCAAGGASARP